jgi:hypothetical protein
MKWHQSSHDHPDQVWLRSRLEAVSEALEADIA